MLFCLKLVLTELKNTERFVLSHGLYFCLPPTSVKREEILADFEVLYAQLVHHKPSSEEQLAALKARLSDLAHAYCGSPIDLGDFFMTKECFQAIKSLRMNEEILITKPDKGAGIVILNKNDYNDKMKTILNDTTKFLDLGPVMNNDNTAKIESWIQRRLLQLRKEYLISKQVYEAIQPLALSDRACMVFRKYTKRTYPYVRFCLRPDRPNIS